ncbi:10328_t:CDS:2, partial [Ambispora leptoticha]
MFRAFTLSEIFSRETFTHDELKQQYDEVKDEYNDTNTNYKEYLKKLERLEKLKILLAGNNYQNADRADLTTEMDVLKSNETWFKSRVDKLEQRKNKLDNRISNLYLDIQNRLTRNESKQRYNE